MSFNVERVEKHGECFPIGLFTDDLWRGLKDAFQPLCAARVSVARAS